MDNSFSISLNYFVSIILLLIEPVKSCTLLRLLNFRTLINLKIRFWMSRSMTLAWNNYCVFDTISILIQFYLFVSIAQVL